MRNSGSAVNNLHSALDSYCILNELCDFLPKYTQIQLQIILFLLFWDVLWIINDLLAPPSLFFHEFQQNRGFYGQYQTIPISVGSLTITNIPKYTLKFRLSKVIYIYKLFLYFYRNSDTENNSSLFKTYAVDLRRLLCEQVVCLITEKKGAYWSFPVFIFVFILKRKKRNKINK